MARVVIDVRGKAMGKRVSMRVRMRGDATVEELKTRVKKRFGVDTTFFRLKYAVPHGSVPYKNAGAERTLKSVTKVDGYVRIRVLTSSRGEAAQQQARAMVCRPHRPSQRADPADLAVVFGKRNIRSQEVTVWVGLEQRTWGRGWRFGREEAPPHVETPYDVPFGAARGLRFAGTVGGPPCSFPKRYIYSVEGVMNPGSRWGGHLTVPFPLLPEHAEVVSGDTPGESMRSSVTSAGSACPVVDGQDFEAVD